MIRNLKALGLLVVAALALSAMLASAASAQLGTFTAGATPETHKTARIVGEQYGTAPENYFKAGTAFVHCDQAKFTGTLNGGVGTTLTIEPDYTHCYTENGAEIRPATVTMNGCDYTFTQPETIEPKGTGLYTGKADLTCPVVAGVHKRIIIHVYAFGNSTETSHFFNACTIEVYPNATEVVNGHTTQQLGGHVIYQNKSEPPKDDVTVSATVTEITSATNCPGQPAHTSEAEYVSKVTVKAFEDPGEGQYDAWISD